MKEQAEKFIENSRPAIEHLFDALGAYEEVLKRAEATVEEVENSKQFFSDLFMYRDQWSPNANHNYAQYRTRMEALEKQRAEAQENKVEKIERALFNMGSTIESMSSLAGAVLQIAKQALSIRYAGKPDLPYARSVGTQNIVDVVWEGRNHAMHWDEGAPREQVRNMLDALETDLGITVEVGKNNCLSILDALEWNMPEAVISDIKKLIQ
ncbi:hypothetical protein FRE64_06430 [Euhalothece natronophila Z-M001]|uniref:Uncharacterized protein n=1 Tax=Euhalothece natronophila Z-M001 TaxID=522448 RepID=A0A5B8NN66_9CHRO|nr:hypothetical protein [Euhalothece natronophila]QDZ39599.1 hypothetical protein FRE64_06430 [Euhalothece natronophila Z-M001]